LVDVAFGGTGVKGWEFKHKFSFLFSSNASTLASWKVFANASTREYSSRAKAWVILLVGFVESIEKHPNTVVCNSIEGLKKLQTNCWGFFRCSS
jgi:hypothetical protein